MDAFERDLEQPKRIRHLPGFTMHRYRRDSAGRELSVLFARDEAVAIHCRYRHEVPMWSAMEDDAQQFIPRRQRLPVPLSRMMLLPAAGGRGWTLTRADLARRVIDELAGDGHSWTSAASSLPTPVPLIEDTVATSRQVELAQQLAEVLPSVEEPATVGAVSISDSSHFTCA